MKLRLIILIVLLKGFLILGEDEEDEDSQSVSVEEGSSIPIEEESSIPIEEESSVPLEEESSDDNPSEHLNNEAESNNKVKMSRLGVTEVLGSTVKFDGDNSDIDEFDFGLDELDEEEDIDISANHIKPSDWVPILENYILVLKEKIQNANQLKILEEQLKERGKHDFEDEEKEKTKCASLEYSILTDIKSLPVEKQKTVFDVDRDGIPDFDFVDISKHLE